MTESQELRELKRLLRAGFCVERVQLRARGKEGDRSGVEITTTKQGSTANFTISQDMLSRHNSTGPLHVNVPDDERFIEIALRKPPVSRTITSTTEDMWDFCVPMHPSLDEKGNVTLRRFADNGRHIDEAKWLATVIADAKNKTQQLMQSGTKVDYKLKTLLASFLRSRDWGNARFLPLKEQFFELQTVLLVESHRMLSMQLKVLFPIHQDRSDEDAGADDVNWSPCFS